MTCPVCKDDFSSTQESKKPLISGTCGHGACSDCFYKGMMTGGKLCMLCRTYIKNYSYNYQLMETLYEPKTINARVDEHMQSTGREIIRSINDYVELNYPKGIYKYGDTPFCNICRNDIIGSHTVDKYLDHAYSHLTDDGRFKPY